MTTATACPHCGGPTANSNRHCKPEDSSTCDWLVCRGCHCPSAGRHHYHPSGARGACKAGRT